jgi:peptide subunit release factor 1 (eRF1)
VPVQAATTPGYFANPSAIPSALEALRAAPSPPEGVLSAYLDTRPGQVQPHAYLVAFRNGCRQVMQQLDPSVQDSFASAASRAEKFLEDVFVARHPGLALFAGPDADYLFAVPLPTQPDGTLAWDRRPLLEPLEAELDEHERVALVLIDRRRARLFTMFLGGIERDQMLDSDARTQLAAVHRGLRQAAYVQRYAPGARLHGPGASFVRGGATGARHDDDDLLRLVRETSSALLELFRRAPFDRLFLAGADDGVAVLRTELPRPLRARLMGTLPLAADAPAADVLRACRVAAEAVERRLEIELVDELLPAARAGRAVVGFDTALAAISEGRLYHLLVADTFDGVASECGACGRLLAGPGPCPACGSRSEPILDIRERAAERARGLGARVETVAGQAASRLLANGGLGGWTRY